MSDIKPPAQPQRTQSAEGFLASEENRTGLARTSTLTWQAMCEFAEAYAQSLKQAAAPAEPVADPSKEELKAALGQARDYVVGLSAYLATCATATIIENLETTITSLHKERDYLERLLSGDGKE